MRRLIFTRLKLVFEHKYNELNLGASCQSHILIVEADVSKVERKESELTELISGPLPTLCPIHIKHFHSFIDTSIPIFHFHLLCSFLCAYSFGSFSEIHPSFHLPWPFFFMNKKKQVNFVRFFSATFRCFLYVVFLLKFF